MIDIVLVSWYRPKITELTIRTIHRNTRRENYRLIVVDNGSPKEQQDMLCQLQDNGYIDELLLNDTNLGLEPARNQGLMLVESEYFICADNDCLPEPQTDTDWVEKLVNLMRQNQKYAAIACRTQVMIGTGNIFDGHEDEAIVQFGHPGGSLRIMLTAPVKESGGWRDEEAGRGSEERYICGKLRDAGWETGFATKVNCLHLFGDRTQGTDRWGYAADWLPGDTGHSDIWHPVLNNGDDVGDVIAYAGESLAKEYFK